MWRLRAIASDRLRLSVARGIRGCGAGRDQGAPCPMTLDLAVALAAEPRVAVAVRLPISGATVSVQFFLRREESASEPVPRTGSCWAPNKPAVLWDGEPTWAEYVLEQWREATREAELAAQLAAIAAESAEQAERGEVAATEIAELAQQAAEA